MKNKEINKTIADYASIPITMGDLQQSFSLMNLLDYFVAVERLVLYDSIILVGATPHAQSETSRFGKFARDTLKPWFDAGVIFFDTEPAPLQDIRNLTNDLVTIGNKTKGGQTLETRLEDAFFETGRLIASEKARHLPGLPLLRQAPYYMRKAYVSQVIRCAIWWKITLT